MVISVGPGKFYGKSLPRPRFYTDVKFNDHRVNPPVSVTDPFMSWAEEAHWSMGGLSFKRLRLQGKIEGNANKLRNQLENISRSQAQTPVQPPRSDLVSASDSPSPPDAPVAVKRRRFMSPIEEENEEENEKEGDEEFEGEEFKVVTRSVRRKRLVKKLGEEFDRVASENEGSDGSDRIGSKLVFSKALGDGSDRISSKLDLLKGASDGSGRIGSKLELLKGSGDGSESVLVGLRTRRRRRLMKSGEAVGKVVEEYEKKKLRSVGEKSPNCVSENGVRTSPRLAKRVNN